MQVFEKLCEGIQNSTTLGSRLYNLENFDKNAYLDLNPDVAKAGVDAESHYLNYGINEGRKYTYISTMEISKNVNVHLTNLIEQ